MPGQSARRAARPPLIASLLLAATATALFAVCGGGPNAAPGDQPARPPVAEPIAPPVPLAPEAAGPSDPTLLPPALGRSGGAEDLPLPPLDRRAHTVPLDRVRFDTFDGRSVQLTDAEAALIARLRNVIPPIDAPRYDPAEGGAWLDGGDMVLGYLTSGGDAYAYPHKILNLHEIVNDELDGVPVAVTYCPLCRSGVVYDRRLDGRTLRFGNTSALYESDLIMFDYQTNSYWWQVPGRAIVDTLAGAALCPLPSQSMTWEQWRTLHPDTRVLSRDTGFPRDYSRDPFTDLGEFLDEGGLPFGDPDSNPDRRLAPSDLVLGVAVGAQHAAYSLTRLGDAALNDTLGGRPVVVFSRAEGPSGAVYFAEVDGRTLRFAVDGEGYRDEQTGSRWDLAGRAIAGPLAGERLEAPPSRSTFWYAYVAAFPDVEVRYRGRHAGSSAQPPQAQPACRPQACASPAYADSSESSVARCCGVRS